MRSRRIFAPNDCNAKTTIRRSFDALTLAQDDRCGDSQKIVGVGVLDAPILFILFVITKKKGAA